MKVQLKTIKKHLLGGNPVISRLYVLFLQGEIIKIEGIHRVTEGFSAKSREKELTGEKTPVRGTLGVKRQNGYHSGRLTPGMVPFWALNARMGTILGV